MKKMIKIAILCMALVGSMVANEDQINDNDSGNFYKKVNPFYVGATLGLTSSKANINTTGYSVDKTENGVKAFIGYQYNKFLSIEGFVANLGGGSASKTISSITYDFSVSTKTVGLAGVAIYPMHEMFNPFIKIGVHRWNSKTNTTVTNISTKASMSVSKKHSGSDILYGFGFNSNLAEDVAVRVEWERYNLGNGSNLKNTDFYSVALIYKF